MIKTRPREDGRLCPPVREALRVLVVDDDRDTVLSLMLLLGDEGHDTRSAGNGEQMWSVLNGFDANAILLDINLPDRNGYELAREIRRRYGERGPALIAVTAWNKGADKLLAQMAGFDHHLGKPYDPLALVGLLRSVQDRLPPER